MVHKENGNMSYLKLQQTTSTQPQNKDNIKTKSKINHIISIFKSGLCSILAEENISPTGVSFSLIYNATMATLYFAVNYFQKPSNRLSLTIQHEATYILQPLYSCLSSYESFLLAMPHVSLEPSWLCPTKS